MTHLKLGVGFIAKHNIQLKQNGKQHVHVSCCSMGQGLRPGEQLRSGWVGTGGGRLGVGVVVVAGALLGASHGLCFFSERHAFFLISF